MIQSIKPLHENISIIIHLNNICNFKCDYCIAWREFSWKYISDENILKLETEIKKIKYITKSNINIDLTGWEPTLNKNFIDILERFSSIPDVNLQVSTNWLLLCNFEDLFIKSKILKLNKDKIKFNISFHFFEYIWKISSFINNIKFLEKNWYYYNIKFLLPDNNTTLSDFLSVRDNILSNIKINNWEFNYYLILDTFWKVSSTYSKEIIDFYNLSENDSNNDIDSDSSIEKDLEVIFENWTKEYNSIEDIKSKWLNNFKWYKCNYISKKILSINITVDWKAIFWPCHTLDKIRYDIEGVSDIINNWWKTIICPEVSCVSWIFFPKEISDYRIKIISLEKKYFNIFSKIINNLEIIDLSISIKKNITLISKINDFFIYFYIENTLYKDSYYLEKDNIWYYFVVKDKNNIIQKTEKLDKKIREIIENNILIFSKIDNLFKNLL